VQQRNAVRQRVADTRARQRAERSRQLRQVQLACCNLSVVPEEICLGQHAV
jgi:hypothetical protein